MFGVVLLFMIRKSFNFTTQILVLPPLSRCQPYWYSANVTIITSCFSKTFNKSPERILVLPQFDCSPASFSQDGIHFIAGEGER
jgi:hypothetical protein